MNISRFFKILSTQLAIMLLILTIGFSVNTQAGQIFSGASGKGKSSCAESYPANADHEAAKASKGGCWSCSKGYERNKLKSIKSPKACKKHKFNMKARKSKVEVKLGACKGKDVWKRKGACWTCPSGYKRTLKLKKDGTPICKPRANNKYKYAQAKRRGDVIGSCPKGFLRNPLKKSGDEKACIGFKKSKNASKANFKSDNEGLIQEKIAGATELIAELNVFKGNLKPLIDRKGMKNITKSDLRRAGAAAVMRIGEALKFCSYTVTVGGDGAALLGGNASGGIAFGPKDCDNYGGKWDIAWLATANLSSGASAGGDVSFEVGIWKSKYNELHGFAWGFVTGGAVGPGGATAAGWMGIDWKPGQAGKFAGITLGYQGGAMIENEFNWGYTFQKGTLNACKKATVHAVNKTGVDIKVIDVDYHDYYKKVWRSEGTPNRKISANGKPYLWKFNLNQVDNAFTQIRVKYRKKDSDGKYSKKVYRDWSDKLLCTEGKKYRVNLEL